MTRSLDRRAFLKGLAVLAAAAPAAALVPDGGRAQDSTAVADSTSAAADTTAAKPGGPPPAPPTYGPDFSICRNEEERALLQRQYASALEVAQAIRKAPLPPGVEPVTTFAALARTKTLSATVPPAVPAPGTPRPEEER